ncbi:MAG: hypothetical protein ACJ8AD_16150 [Gemmatimonadaceae bacterium]
MPACSVRFAAVGSLLLLVGCHPEKGIIPPDGKLTVGQSLSVTGPTTFQLEPGPTSGDYVAVLVNTGLVAGAIESFTLRGDTLVAPSSYLGGPTVAALARLPLTPDGTPDAPVLDRAFEARLRASERAVLTPMFAGARTWYAARSGSRAPSGSASPAPFQMSRSNSVIPSNVQVGDTVTVNVNGVDNCINPIYHKARVTAIGTHAIILDDVQNPRPGFSDADYARYAARFDTMVYPMDVGVFGEPTDIDNNGHIVLIFTRAVNALTPAGSSTYVGGFTFSRDLFPLTATPRAEACATSNVGEYFYLLAPDPLGTINGNRRSTGFVDSNTTAVIAHEFQHLINASRRLYITNAAAFEAKWLDEGLAHVAEELLFYRESGLAPRSNVTGAVVQSAGVKTAFSLDMAGNSSRYRSFLLAPAKSSPYAANDSLTTRGGAWSLLRYLADRKAATDGDIFMRLVNSADSGTANLQGVFGSDLAGEVRDWAVSNAVDDMVTTETALTQPSWNWHSVYPSNGTVYPLPITTMQNGSSYTGTVTAGGAAYYKLGVAANASATFSLAQTGAGNLQLVIVRTR